MRKNEKTPKPTQMYRYEKRLSYVIIEMKSKERRRRMLPPVTEKYEDRSTDAFFQFAFFCAECGAVWKSERYPFSLNDSPPKSMGEKKAHEIMWKAEHDAAYERANTGAIFHFNKCPSCGKAVCDRCFSEFEDVCIQCEKNKRTEE